MTSIEERPYFASESSGSENRLKAIEAGLVKDGEPYYQLQKNDALGLFESDEQAVQQALQDESDGCPYATEQLALNPHGYVQLTAHVRDIQEANIQDYPGAPMRHTRLIVSNCNFM